jgi:hypothetical protein
MRILKQFIVLVVIICGMVYSTPFAVAEDYSPAYLYLGITEDAAQEQIAATVNYNTGGRFTNAVSMRIKFPAEIVQAEEIIINESVCGMVIENTIDNASGEIVLTCGSIGNGWTGKGELANITFAKKSSGWTEFSFAPGTMMLAGDGSAANILEMAIGKTIITD